MRKHETQSLELGTDSLEGWKWWAWQIGGCGLFFVVLEIVLNQIGLTMLPWR